MSTVPEESKKQLQKWFHRNDAI